MLIARAADHSSLFLSRPAPLVTSALDLVSGCRLFKHFRYSVFCVSLTEEVSPKSSAKRSRKGKKKVAVDIPDFTPAALLQDTLPAASIQGRTDGTTPPPLERSTTLSDEVVLRAIQEVARRGGFDQRSPVLPAAGAGSQPAHSPVKQPRTSAATHGTGGGSEDTPAGARKRTAGTEDIERSAKRRRGAHTSSSGASKQGPSTNAPPTTAESGVAQGAVRTSRRIHGEGYKNKAVTIRPRTAE
ncbi:hypothetical protein CPC08DRAFT_769124 [Agrocybe pediades]|nr:hypothetical protein CPC08DRAFT_769124 [Agrocybe pediades]